MQMTNVLKFIRYISGIFHEINALNNNGNSVFSYEYLKRRVLERVLINDGRFEQTGITVIMRVVFFSS